ncbi:glycosyltransferase [Micromonospora sp. NPDC049679]|uniref:glycosyltransferase n=1 Tax=Micromonospora sp. NPDC049679 TaxID=3155920 RepID=UPI0033DD9250
MAPASTYVPETRSNAPQVIGDAGRSGSPRAYGLLSTYPPTLCGLATFTASLAGSLTADQSGDRVGVVRMVDGPSVAGPPEVVHELNARPGAASAVAAAGWLNRFDVAVVQHEYGIFGGRDGDQILDVLERVTVPVVAVLHTVLMAPTPHQRHVLQKVIAAADAVVTMTESARSRLSAIYGVDPGTIDVIPHGAWPTEGPPSRPPSHGRPVILTWGLLGPGKGLEWAVAALPALRAMDPTPCYVVAGQTHPRVFAREGERYRHALQSQATSLGVADMVRFEPGYRNLDQLRRLVDGADVVLLPYDSVEQVTSGVLIEAVASQTPVVATRFPHAVELLADGVGLLVPHRDPVAIADALRRVLTEPTLAAGMSASAAPLAAVVTWPAVAERFRRVADAVVQRRAAVTR